MDPYRQLDIDIDVDTDTKRQSLFRRVITKKGRQKIEGRLL